MRLTEIKLAGFKSFVDPTRIPLPGQLVGIVGPNGCGKSNIIDAVRWVLGESSAKHLRGESMQDVLFNGGGGRQPVNRASVELVFDNSLGKAAGQWSSYAEIVIKRVLERDGDSSYYINNIHVRRRDISDLFLGTGLGARAYAIIEQGMISRVIEAKPEEVRVFLEEAAGVSKYRERRKETENRLADTRENLQRVEDIRLELDKQLTHLQEQAEVAQRYNELNGQLTLAQNLLWLQRKRDASAARAKHAQEIERLGIELEAETAQLRETERKLVELREQHHETNDAVNTAQGGLYEANAEVSRIQQQIQHVRDNRERIAAQLASLRNQLTQGEQHLQTQQANQTEWTQKHEQAQAGVLEAQAASARESELLPAAEQAFRDARQKRDDVQRAVSENAQTLRLEQTKIEHARKILDQFALRSQRLNEERAALVVPDGDALEQRREAVAASESEYREKRATLEAEETALPQIERELRERKAGVETATQQATALEARVHALRQLQDKIARGEKMQGWIASHGLNDARRLWQDIEIESGWEDALEAVLRERLNGVGLNDLEQASSWLADLPPGKITAYAASHETPAAITPAFDGRPLLSYVRCKHAALEGVLRDWLAQVYVVQDRGEGFAKHASLPAGVALVSADGHVFTRHSVSFHAPDSELHGVLSRQREIEQLESELATARANVADLNAEYADAESGLERRKAQVNLLRAEVEDLRQAHHEAELEITRISEQAQRATQRGEQIAAELAEIASQVNNEQAQVNVAQESSVQFERQRVSLQAEFEAAEAALVQAQSALDAQRQSQQQAQRAAQEADFSLRTAVNKIAEIENSIALIVNNLETLKSGIATQEADLAGLDEAPLNAQLEQAIALRGEREQALAQARDALEAAETALRESEQARLEIEQKLNPIRERINELKLKEQEARLTEEQYAQQLIEAQADEAALAGQLEEAAKRASALQADITRLSNEIKALGAVNLAALEELTTSRERKAYLDAQSEDLTLAMTTLEDAIRKIDRESRERLQATFDEVSKHFSEIFPTLFGGGQARLELTGEEILDAGIHIIAQPPGKKNSSIHLLSGGEKALTAMSLVFALFQLNPAPFCLLDEVDAPLDDSNTERFCKLIQKMSSNSQFLYISHNKITMEIANQLVGITMQEAGVSRVVAVDVEEAMKLAEKAA